MRVWKHHIAADFEQRGIPTHPNGGGAGGDVFLDEAFMRESLPCDGSWYIADLDVTEDDLDFCFDDRRLARLRRDVESPTGFYPLVPHLTEGEVRQAEAAFNARGIHIHTMAFLPFPSRDDS